MLYYADLLKVNLITLVIPDHRVFLPAKKSQVAAWGKWRKTWQQIKKWFYEGGTKDEPIHQSGSGVWTCCHAWCQARCQARCQAVWGNPPCQHPEAVCPRRKDGEVVRTKNALNHAPPPSRCHGRQSRSMQKNTGRPTGRPPLARSVAILHVLLFQLIRW